MTHKDLIIAQCRKRGIKLKDLAKRLGVPQSTLSETMRRGKPDYATLERLSNALGCLPGDLLPHTADNKVTCPNCGHTFGVETKPKEE